MDQRKRGQKQAQESTDNRFLTKIPQNVLKKQQLLQELGGNTEYPSIPIHLRRLKLDPTSYSVWIENLSARPETWKLLRENIRKTLQDIGTNTDFSNRTPIDREKRTM